jgi:hypothetical protein
LDLKVQGNDCLYDLRTDQYLFDGPYLEVYLVVWGIDFVLDGFDLLAFSELKIWWNTQDMAY